MPRSLGAAAALVRSRRRRHPASPVACTSRASVPRSRPTRCYACRLLDAPSLGEVDGDTWHADRSRRIPGEGRLAGDGDAAPLVVGADDADLLLELPLAYRDSGASHQTPCMPESAIRSRATALVPGTRHPSVQDRKSVV